MYKNRIYGASAGRASDVPRSISIKDARLCRETGASITIQSSDELEQLRARLRKMPDDELVGFGKAARSCAGTQDAPTRLSSKWKSRVPSGGAGTRKAQ